MLFQVTEIEFDFDEYDDFDHNEQQLIDNVNKLLLQQQLVDETIGQIWEAVDEDDLVEEITCATGWCIKSIDYRHILS